MTSALRVRLVVILAALVGLWAMNACDNGGDGDGDGDGDTDGDTDTDADTDTDGDMDGDMDGDTDTDADADGGDDAMPDGDTVPLSCTETVNCVNACGDNMDCIEACAYRVCNPAAVELAALTQCTVTKCASDCAVRTSTECGDCVEAECLLQLAACTTASCTPGEKSCGQLIFCLTTCDGSACDDCGDPEEVVCAAAADEFGALETCAGDSCSAQCGDGFNAENCGTCLLESCQTQATACLATPCES